ncbi:MAG TPA: HlyD family efflux transporter periplasmic adaptor subunit [Bryobacteraceae bacterium]|nr:HlyD family efflux transporter periplasmic adaptor subunit [Bryobacteraceae bacterium]
MRNSVRALAPAVLVLALSGCMRPTPPTAQAASPPAAGESPHAKHEVRLTGTLEAVHSSKVLVPQVWGSGGPVTLTKLIPNGVRVEEGDLIALFDNTQQVDAARNAQARYEDLGHQVEQKKAQNRADSENRTADLMQADADFAKAKLELQKGPILSEIDRLKNEVKADVARQHVDSLKKSNAFHDASDAAALRNLELQRDRQKVMLERTQNNLQKLELRAPLAGMVAHQSLYRYNTMGHAQEGDQLYRGQPLVSIFDPSAMRVRCAVGEPDGAALVDGARATVYLDAYPELALPAHFEFASPVAASALGSPVKTFTAVFKLDKTDPHLMPDLSAAVVVEAPLSGAGGGK